MLILAIERKTHVLRPLFQAGQTEKHILTMRRFKAIEKLRTYQTIHCEGGFLGLLVSGGLESRYWK